MSTLQNLLKEADSCKEKISSFALKSYVTNILGQSAPGAYVLELAERRNTAVTEDIINELNQLITGTKEAPKEIPYRKGSPWEEDGYLPPDSLDVPRLMGHYTEQILSSAATLHPIELAAMAYKRLADIAPFNQGNRETAYYLMNFILICAGYCPAEPFYEDDGYINALAKSRSRHDMEPFSLLVVQYVLKAQKDCLKASALL